MSTGSVLLSFGQPLKYASFFGLFPSSFKDGIFMEPRGKWSCLLRWFLTFAFLTMCVIISVWVLLYHAEEGEDTLVWYILMYMESSKGIVDKICFISPIITNMYAGTLLMWEISGMGKVLTLFETNLGDILYNETISRRPILKNIVM